MDLHDKAVGQRNLFERLVAKIPGFKGYMERELRRDTDKLQRDFCADKLFAQKGKVKEALEELVAGGDIDGITPFEKLLNRLDGVAQKIRSADRGWAGLFDAVKVTEETLERVYKFDLSLADGVSEVEKKISQLGSVDKATALQIVKEATKLVNEIDDYFAKREEILEKGA
ncbi:MAG: hypothetical protein D6731_11260 [Planctomycetota bacterium]|nr:MAG: hypothetical protein D6731_11260 [Planctomycetota bacterium]